MPNPIPAHNPTDGVQSAAYVQVSGTGVTAQKTVSAGKPNPGGYNLSLSLSGTSTCQLTPLVVDAQNNTMPLGSFTLSASAAASGGNQTLTGVSIPTAAIVAGMSVTISGFAQAVNNGTFAVVSTTSTTIVVANAAGTAETHAATAQFLVGSVLYKSYNPSQATVSAGGLITAVALGQAIIEVSFPVFDNSQGNQNGVAAAAIYAQIVVQVGA